MLEHTPLESDVQRLAAESPTVCLNCGADLPGQYCPDCGQKDQPLRQPAHAFIAESASEYFGLDGRLWRTLKMLLFQPGTLTVAYLDGRRARFLRPLRIYLTTTVLFFFLLSFQDTFDVDTEALKIEAVVGDSLTVETIDDALHPRIDAVEAEEAAYLMAASALADIGADSLVASIDTSSVLADSLDAVHDRLDTFPDDSLLAVASLPQVVVASLRDSSLTSVPSGANSMFGEGFFEPLPEWAKGDLARRFEAAETPSERRLLSAQVQRAVTRQIPTTLFLILPLFALMLKGLYMFGMGRRPRRRPRPRPLADDAQAVQRWAHSVRVGWWRWRMKRAHSSARRRRDRSAKALERRVGGWPRRARQWVAQHRLLRWHRVWRLGQLRRSLRMERNPFYAEHLVFALHTHAFTFVMFVIVLVSGLLNAPSWLSGFLFAAIPIYFLVAQKRVYGQGWPTTVVKSLALGIVYSVVLGFGVLLAAGLASQLG